MTEPERDHLFKAWANATERSTPELSAGVRQRVLAAHAERGQRRAFPSPYRWALGGFALAVTLAVALLLRTPAAPSFRVAGHSGAVGTWLEAGPASELSLHFSEGTQVSLAMASRGRVTRVTHGGARIELARGAVDAEVTHLPGADWAFAAGPFEVIVTGTHLNLAWAPASGRFELSVSRGSVLVKGPLIVGQQEVRAGQTCRIDLGRGVMQLAQGSATAEKHVTERPAPFEPSASPHPEPVESSAPQPASSAVAPRAAPVEQLLDEARAERLAGRPAGERALLLAVRKRAPGQSAAAQAAYLLGRASAAAEAARWFETYLREEPQGILAREASGRLIESYRAAGNGARAKLAASRYLARYPNGPHAALAKQTLARSESQD